MLGLNSMKQYAKNARISTFLNLEFKYFLLKYTSAKNINALNADIWNFKRIR
ncbi:hypothetical protein MSATCC33130_2400 [Metamycoplasma salivarium]|nr:hypothetical protein MSATCC23557_2240 [Metamycoplasma salivarium]GIZ06886.1 hypothetical protein MSATCC33130_2400 [Metamycoplasma salivarium]